MKITEILSVKGELIFNPNKKETNVYMIGKQTEKNNILQQIVILQLCYNNLKYYDAISFVLFI